MKYRWSGEELVKFIIFDTIHISENKRIKNKYKWGTNYFCTKIIMNKQIYQYYNYEYKNIFVLHVHMLWNWKEISWSISAIILI